MKKERPILCSTPMVKAILSGKKNQTRRIMKDAPGGHENDDGYDSSIIARCPFGDIGDLLWVRESFIGSNDFGFAYKAQVDKGLNAIQKHIEQSHLLGPVKWKPSIFMPKVAARIWLEIQHVSFEPLASITDEECIAEGIDQDKQDPSLWKNYLDPTSKCVSPRQSFETLWDSIHGVGSWKENHWVWVIKFKRVEEQELEKLREEAYQ